MEAIKAGFCSYALTTSTFVTVKREALCRPPFDDGIFETVTTVKDNIRQRHASELVVVIVDVKV